MKGDQEQGKFTLCKFFKKNEGPYKLKMMTGESDVFSHHCQRAADKVEVVTRTMDDMKIVVDREGYQEQMKKVQQNSTKRAREALAKRQDEVAAKRKTTVSCAAIVADAYEPGSVSAEAAGQVTEPGIVSAEAAVADPEDE